MEEPDDRDDSAVGAGDLFSNDKQSPEGDLRGASWARGPFASRDRSASPALSLAETAPSGDEAADTKPKPDTKPRRSNTLELLQRYTNAAKGLAGGGSDGNGNDDAGSGADPSKGPQATGAVKIPFTSRGSASGGKSTSRLLARWRTSTVEQDGPPPVDPKLPNRRLSKARLVSEERPGDDEDDSAVRARELFSDAKRSPESDLRGASWARLPFASRDQSASPALSLAEAAPSGDEEADTKPKPDTKPRRSNALKLIQRYTTAAKGLAGGGSDSSGNDELRAADGAKKTPTNESMITALSATGQSSSRLLTRHSLFMERGHSALVPPPVLSSSSVPEGEPVPFFQTRDDATGIDCENDDRDAVLLFTMDSSLEVVDVDTDEDDGDGSSVGRRNSAVRRIAFFPEGVSDENEDRVIDYDDGDEARDEGGRLRARFAAARTSRRLNHRQQQQQQQQQQQLLRDQWHEKRPLGAVVQSPFLDGGGVGEVSSTSSEDDDTFNEEESALLSPTKGSAFRLAVERGEIYSPPRFHTSSYLSPKKAARRRMTNATAPTGDAHGSPQLLSTALPSPPGRAKEVPPTAIDSPNFVASPRATGDCPVCLFPLSDPETLEPCGHSFCGSCITTIRERSRK